MYKILTGPKNLSKEQHRIWPIFIPFAACKVRCIFCAQDAQTGQSTKFSLKALLQKAWQEIANHQRKFDKPRKLELAFYGGTFTALPFDEQKDCLDLIQDLISRGWVDKARCSTRPDACEIDHLNFLAKNGLCHIELGIQSFNEASLNACSRGYSMEIALKACDIVQKSACSLGIQLMPGMPELNTKFFLQDVDMSLSFLPKTLRLYPCLVLESTKLASLWQEGSFMPWDLKETVTALSKATLKAWEQGVPIIRFGLAYSPTMNILAGPQHKALGSMVMGEVLIMQVEEIVHKEGKKAKALHLPLKTKGFWRGHKGALLERWQALGIQRIVFVDEISEGLLFID